MNVNVKDIPAPQSESSAELKTLNLTPTCEIFQVAHEQALRWKWRAVAADGSVTEPTDTYEYHYQCAAAARACGYRPDAKWLAVK